MNKNFTKIASMFVLFFTLMFFLQSAYAVSSKEYFLDQYDAVIIGKMVSKEVKKEGKYYYTEYKLKPKEWVKKKNDVEEVDLITVEILGADLPDKGISIIATNTPGFIPMKKQAMFLLTKTRNNENAYTINSGGVIYGSELNKFLKEDK